MGSEIDSGRIVAMSFLFFLDCCNVCKREEEEEDGTTFLELPGKQSAGVGVLNKQSNPSHPCSHWHLF